MVAEIEVCTAMNTLKLLEAEREIEFYVGCGVGIMSQLLVIVETVVFRSQSKVDMPFHAVFLPLPEPLHLGAGLDEELHLHLLEFTHAEYKLAGHNFISEGFSYLRDSERNLHAAGLLNVDTINEDALRGLRTQIYHVCLVSDGSELRREHKVELPYICPVLCAADRAYDIAVENDLFVFSKVIRLFCSHIAVVDLFIVSLVAKHVWICLTELGLVKGISEFLFSFLDLLVHLLLDFGEVVFNQHVCTVSFLGILVVYQRIVEGGDMP